MKETANELVTTLGETLYAQFETRESFNRSILHKNVRKSKPSKKEHRASLKSERATSGILRHTFYVNYLRRWKVHYVQPS